MQAIAARKGERERSYVVVEDRGPDDALPDVATFSPGFRHHWEIRKAWATAWAFEAWLIELAARERIPMDGALLPLRLLSLWVEAELVLRAMEPERWAELAVEPEQYAVDPAAEGLTIRHVRRDDPREPKSPAIHPGCQRDLLIDDRQPCGQFRRKGDRLCPSCTTLYLAQERVRRRAA